MTSDLSKVFGDVAAVNEINLRVPSGSVFGFLGPNGSGKTTTTRMLLGLVRPTSGVAEVLGSDISERAMNVLPRVGALVEGPAFYPFLSGARNLVRLDAAESGHRAGRAERVAEALARVGLTSAANKKYRQYSLGMKQRLVLAGALMRPRELIILDEPTNGLDPQGTREVRELIRGLAADGTTVFLSSHLLTEVEQVCTHAAVLSRGKILVQGSLTDLYGERSPSAQLTVSDPAAAHRILSSLDGVGVITAKGDDIGVQLVNVSPEQLNRALVENGVDVRALSSQRPSLEDLFVELTGDGFDVE